MLLAGKTFREIATALGLVYGTVLWYAQQIYKQHGVCTLPELLRKHGHTIAPPPTIEVRRRLLAGQSIKQIAAELGCGKMIIYNQRQQLRKRGARLLNAKGLVPVLVKARAVP
jgi:DNA-binding CsgD family transcriptional regulator